jgi:hypothetical protein
MASSGVLIFVEDVARLLRRAVDAGEEGEESFSPLHDF